MFLPLSDDQPKRPPVVVTWLLLGLCVVLFFHQLGMNPRETYLFIHKAALVPAWLLGGETPPPALAAVPGPVRLITYQYLHGGFWHIFSNMLCLFVFGPTLERRCGPMRFLALYTLCGMAGGLGHALSVGPQDDTPMLGASGALAGLQGAYLLLLPHARVRVFFILFRFWLPAWLLIGFWFLTQLLSVRAGVEDDVAYMAHIAGFIAGLALIHVFRDRQRDPPPPPPSPPPAPPPRPAWDRGPAAAPDRGPWGDRPRGPWG